MKRHRKEVRYRLPAEINHSVTLRFKGLGKTRNGLTGDLMLVVRIDRGEDLSAEIWISESEARTGCDKVTGRGKRLFWGFKEVPISVPVLSVEGSVVRARGAGKQSDFCWGMPFFNRPYGNLLVKLRVFPDKVQANYRHVHTLSTENLALEGWVFRKRDHILQTLRYHPVPRTGLGASYIADLFNSGGWRSIASTLAIHLQVHHLPLTFEPVEKLSHAGQYQKMVKVYSNGVKSVQSHVIKIRSEYLNDPFAVVAILAHELCHVIEDQ